MSKNLSDIFPPVVGGGDGSGDGVEEAPKTGKKYARQDETWVEFETGNLEPGNAERDVLLWNSAQDEWMPSGYVPAAITSSTMPSNPIEGMLWQNTSNNVMYVYVRNAFEEVVDQDGYIKKINNKSPNSSGEITLTHTDVGAEKAFAKNTAFNKSFGTSSTTVAYGNHTHSNYATVGTSYTKAESDNKYELKGAGGGNPFPWTGATASFTTNSAGSVISLNSTNARGAEIEFNNGGTRLYMRSIAGSLELVNSGYSAVFFSVSNAGVATAADFVASSDERLKENIEPVKTGVITELDGVSFSWKKDGRKSSGFIAQDVQKISELAHLVHDEGDHLAVNYQGMIPYLLAEIKSLRAEVEMLKLEAK